VTLAVAAVIAYYLGAFVAKHWPAIRDVTCTGHWYHLAAGLFFCLASLALHIGVFRHFLAGLGLHMSYRAAWRIYAVPQLGKYFPGRVAAFAAYTYVARQQGLALTHAWSAIAVFTLYVLQSSLCYALLLLPTALHRFPAGWRYAILAVGLGSIVFCCTPLVWRLVNFGLRLVRQPPLTARPAAGAVLLDMVLLLVRWLLQGIGFLLVAHFIMPIEPSHYTLVLAAMPLAYIVGFVTIVAPAGIGVREGVLIALLSEPLGPGFAAIFAVLTRLVLMTVEVLFASGSVLADWLRPPAAVVATPSSQEPP
jgi:hypothetical protein